MNSSLKSLKTLPGKPLPYGAHSTKDGCNFSISTAEDIRITLCLFTLEKNEKITPLAEIQLDPSVNRQGNTWHICVKDLSPNTLYKYKVTKNDDEPVTILDPYAKCVYSIGGWDVPHGDSINTIYNPYGVICPESNFDWEGDKPLEIPDQDQIIYEMHVRAFTQDKSSNVKAPGTYLGLIDKIPHLVELGVNTIELLPAYEFNEDEYLRCYGPTKRNLCQFWGYSTVNFFSPMRRYAYGKDVLSPITEFKTMVRELHKNGIAVILDVVFNHTAEGGPEERAISFRALDKIYYMTDPSGNNFDCTGCGHTFNANHPQVTQFIIDALHYWVLEMHVDGFRFDLASVLTRDVNSMPMAKPPLIEKINADPVLSKTRMIAEAWDAAGLYQVGSFPSHGGKWSEWNGKYRDTIRKFIKGTAGTAGEFASRISGSQDIYGNGRLPYHSINFVTAHDGFSLRDLVSYNDKHNEENGEDNRDGMNENESWNCGEEGPTKRKEIIETRERQMRNFLLALMVSQGTPMIVMGDEYGHTKKGNNNTWCQDNNLSWFLWDELKKNIHLFRFFKTIIAFRKNNPLLKRTTFPSKEDVEWHGLMLNQPDWNAQFLAFTWVDKEKQFHIFAAFNPSLTTVEVELPELTNGMKWHWIVNTQNPPPKDIFDPSSAPLCKDKKIELIGFSSVLLQAYLN
jgi:isoamylase/glycogen operon protein